MSNFEKCDYRDFDHDEEIFRLSGNKIYLINVSSEVWRERFKENLSDNTAAEIKKIALIKIGNKDFMRRYDRSGIADDRVVITSKDFSAVG
jgi:hypothetical protein